MNDSKKKMKKCFGIEKDTGKVKYSQLPKGWTVSMTFTAKSVRDIESVSFFQLVFCHYSTFGHKVLFLIIYPAFNDF